MVFQDKLIYYYLLFNQYFFTCLNLFKLYFFGIENVKILANGKIKNIFIQYIIYKYLSLIQKITNCPFFGRIKSKLNICSEKIHFTKLDYDNSRSVIINKTNDENTYQEIMEQADSITMDDGLISTIVVTFDLVNGNNKTCLKEFIIAYKDIEEKYNNTLKDILLFNNIPFDEESSVDIKIYKGRERINKTILLTEVYDNHINYFL
jgi:hypothetical protein